MSERDEGSESFNPGDDKVTESPPQSPSRSGKGSAKSYGLSPLHFGSYYHGSGSNWNPYTAEELAPDSDQRSTSSSGSSSSSSDSDSSDDERKKKPQKKPKKVTKKKKPTNNNSHGEMNTIVEQSDDDEYYEQKKLAQRKADERERKERLERQRREDEQTRKAMEKERAEEDARRRKEVERAQAQHEKEERERRERLERERLEDERRRKEMERAQAEEEDRRRKEMERAQAEEEERLRKEMDSKIQAEEEERRKALERKILAEEEERRKDLERKIRAEEEEKRKELERKIQAEENERRKAKKKRAEAEEEKKRKKLQSPPPSPKKSTNHVEKKPPAVPEDKPKKKKKKKKDGVLQRLMKARQKMTEGNKKTKEQLKRENEQKQAAPPVRPPPDVYQKSLNVKSDYEAPSFPKSPEEEEAIQGALSKVLPISKMPSQNVGKLVAAFEKKNFEPGTEIETTSDDGLDEFFYVVEEGRVGVEVDGEQVREAVKGDTVGDTHLYHSQPERSVSFHARTDSTLFRVDQSTYRSIVQTEINRTDEDKRGLVDKTKLFENMSVDHKNKLAAAMKPVSFQAGEIVESDSDADAGENFYLVASGRMLCRDPEGKTPDRVVERGQFVGEDALVPGCMPRKINLVAEEESTAFKVDRSTFETVVGKLKDVVLTPEEAYRLQNIDILRYKPTSKLTKDQMAKLVSKIEDQSFAPGETILEEGTESPAGMYFIRKGTVKVRTGRFNKLKIAGNIFGEELFESAKSRKSNIGVPNHTVVAVDDCICGVLSMDSYHSVHEAKPSKKLAEVSERTETESFADEVKVKEVPAAPSHKYELKNLSKKVMLGEGQFGQVWMVSDDTEKVRRPYALKVQSKWELIDQAQAEICIREKEIMFNLRHPMIIKLCASFQDTNFVYLLLEMVNGGELFSLIHPIDGSGSGLPEDQSRFYAFVLADILKYMHTKKYVYRDLKPENVLINYKGFPTLIDFGFTRKLDVEKTFTLCGTPGYLAPEMVLSEGHTFSADHWALGILTYEMLCQQNPFFYDGMDSTMLYKSIAEDDYETPQHCSAEACDFIAGLLEKDPVYRLGSLAGGEKDVLRHPWFKGMDPGMIRKQKLEAPWIPEVKDPFDTRHFEDWGHIEDKTEERYPELSEKQQLVFDDFDDWE